MKKFFITMIIILSIICLFTGCNTKNIDKIDNTDDTKQLETTTSNLDTDINNDDKENNNTNESEDNKEEIKQVIDTGFKEKLRSLSLTRVLFDEGYELLLQEWIKIWADYAYEQFDIYDYSGEIVKYNSIDVNDNLSVYYDKAFIKFNCDDLIESTEKNSEGMYIDEVYLVQAKTSDKTIYYIDVIMNENQCLDAVAEKALDIVASDERFSEYFSKKDDTETDGKDNNSDDKDTENTHYSMLSEIKPIILSKTEILDGYTLYDVGKSNNKIIMLLGKIDDASTNKYDIKLCTYDYNSKQITDTKDLGIQQYVYSNYYENYGFLVYSGDGKSKTEEINYWISSEGAISEYVKNNSEYFNSPNQTYSAYSDDNGDLYIIDNTTKEALYTFNSICGYEVLPKDHKIYSVQKWIDDTRLLYHIGGYEWSNGYGIIDIETGENTVLEESKLKHEYKFIGNKFYVYYCWFDPIPYKLGYYDLDVKPYKYIEVFNDEQYPEIYDVGGMLEYWRYMTSDEKQILMWAYSGEKHHYIVKTYSLENNKIEKNMCFKVNENSTIFSIDNAFVINDTVLVIVDYSNIYIVNLNE